MNYKKTELLEIQRMLETEYEILPIYNNHPQLMTFRFTNLKLDFAEYIIHIHNNKLLNSCLQVQEIKEYINANNLMKLRKHSF